MTSMTIVYFVLRGARQTITICVNLWQDNNNNCRKRGKLDKLYEFTHEVFTMPFMATGMTWRVKCCTSGLMTYRHIDGIFTRTFFITCCD